MQPILKYPIVFILLACVLSRLPLMLGPGFFLDGDECIVALISRLMLEGESFSLYFWAQKYGLAVFEVLATVPYFLLLGYTTLAAKLGAFTVWTLGTIYLYKAITAISKNKQLALAITVLFILFPAWAVWSMKLCGGYESAFLFSNVLIYIMFDERRKHNIRYYITIGVLLVIIFECQRLWMVGVIPFVVYSIWRDNKRANILYSIAAATVVFLLLVWYKQGITVTYAPPVNLPEPDKFGLYFVRFPDYLYRSFQGNYFFSFYDRTWLVTSLLAQGGMLLFFAMVPWAICNAIKKPEQRLLTLTAVTFIPLSVAYTFLVEHEQGRYLLPVSGYMAIALGVLLARVKLPRVATPAVYGLLVMTGVVSSLFFYNFYEYGPKYKQNILSAIKYLDDNDIRHTYCTECMMPFQIMYYSDMRILSRMPYVPARYQPHSDAVDSVMRANGPIAIIVFRDLTLDMNLQYQFTSDDVNVCVRPPLYELFNAYFFSFKKE